MKKQGIVAVVAGVALVGALAFQEAQGPSGEAAPEAPAANPRAQPIAFPHDTHAGQFRIDCQFCHYSAERSVDAGLPPVQTCAGCHQVVPGRNRPEEVAKVMDYWNRREAIPWVRIYKVADHVHFPHLRHVAAGVECQECHGPVQEMSVIDRVNQPLAMGWCLSCHMEREVSRDCSVCHY